MQNRDARFSKQFLKTGGKYEKDFCGDHHSRTACCNCRIRGRDEFPPESSTPHEANLFKGFGFTAGNTHRNSG
jgi:hypothetical protein